MGWGGFQGRLLRLRGLQGEGWGLLLVRFSSEAGTLYRSSMVRWAFEGLSGSWRAMQSVTLQKYHLGTNQLRFSTNRIRTPVDHSQCVFGGASRILNGKYSADRAIQGTILNPKLLTTISTFPQLCKQSVLSSYFAGVGGCTRGR